MRGRRKRMRLGGQWLLWLVPVALAVMAFAFSPREGEGAGPDPVARADGGKLEEGRHYDWVVADSLLKLMDRCDPGQAMVRRVMREDTFSVYLPLAAEDPKAVRLFLNRRDPADYRDRLPENAPFRVRQEGKRSYGFHFPRQKIDGRMMVPVPFDMLAGLLDNGQ